jgi:valyl-tRNA synthetase
MRGKAVFYPVGWDDNGLPTERRVQNYYGVRCDPSLPYDPGFQPPDPPTGRDRRRPADQVPVSRRNFTELCRKLTGLDEQAYEQVWRRIGLSVDWDTAYRTIGERAMALSQQAFLADLARGDAYLADAPALWDVTFQTAVAQAEVEDREVRGAWHRLAFEGPAGSGPLLVATTRPELLPACVALVVHPDDARYAGLVGQQARTPLFGVSVPVLAHRLADPDKGTGVVMVCTFGDATDVTWWRELNLATRPVIGRDGRLAAEPPPGLDGPGQAAYAELAGLPAAGARKKIAGLLAEAGALRGDPEPVQHTVRFYERGEAPLEIVTSRQWYLRNGSRDEDLRAALLARGQELDWHPEHMRARYDDWVHGLAGDWLVSRQRYFGVPIPVWYPLDARGQPRYQDPIPAPAGPRPADPATDTPPGYQASQRGQPSGFMGDPDVMDTWATSSLTPQIAAGGDPELLSRVFPMDLRPQSHEIIRTWLFYTVLRAHTASGVLPWRAAALSGWILDPDRKKMSKSKGNVTTPAQLLDDYGSDAVRYWASSARLGVDTTFDPAQLKIGRRLATKLLNGSRFVLASIPPPSPGQQPTEQIDLAMLSRLGQVAAGATAAFERFDHAAALAETERFFWWFCDDYLELVKPRGYGEYGPAAAGSAAAALRLALSVLLRLFAPFLPFVTEEVWSWWQDGSVHQAPWPGRCGLPAGPGDPGPLLTAASAAIGAVRKAKSQARLPMRAPAQRLVISAPGGLLAAVTAAEPDIRAAGHLSQVELRETETPDGPVFEVEL